jgi:hypothetical protein
VDAVENGWLAGRQRRHPAVAAQSLRSMVRSRDQPAERDRHIGDFAIQLRVGDPQSEPVRLAPAIAEDAVTAGANDAAANDECDAEQDLSLCKLDDANDHKDRCDDP